MATLTDPIQFLQQQLGSTRTRLLNHGVYQQLESLADLREFMQHHVFAVWDFMSLLKALQRELTCVDLPWVPRGNARTRRLINEIVLEEESDLDAQGEPTSHFELYVQAMKECGADTGPIHRLLAALGEGQPLPLALEVAGVPASVRKFVTTTFDIVDSGQLHVIAAAFTFGREDLIPGMFRHLVNGLRGQFPAQLATMTYYLDRHIQLDEEVHTPLARQMVRELCADDPQRWLDCQQVAARCMEARVELWNGIAQALRQQAAA